MTSSKGGASSIRYLLLTLVVVIGLSGCAGTGTKHSATMPSQPESASGGKVFVYRERTDRGAFFFVRNQLERSDNWKVR